MYAKLLQIQDFYKTKTMFCNLSLNSYKFFKGLYLVKLKEL